MPSQPETAQAKLLHLFKMKFLRVLKLFHRISYFYYNDIYGNLHIMMVEVCIFSKNTW